MKNSRVHVLIVDDSVTIRAMMETVLNKDAGIKVIGEVSSAEEAESVLRDTSPDVTLLDIRLPGMSGLDFLNLIKGWHCKPVIMLSSLSSPGAPERVEALRRGAVGSFNKAKAVSDAPLLIKMIKEAAQGRLRADTDDSKALAEIIAAEEAAGQTDSLSA